MEAQVHRPSRSKTMASEQALRGTMQLVGGTGIEPVTSSVSGKRSPAELTARVGPILRRLGHRCDSDGGGARN